MREVVVVGLAILGGIIIAVHSLADALSHVGYRLGACEPAPAQGFPWGIAIMAVACVIPITVSPGAARVVLEGVVSVIPGRRKKDDEPGPTP